MASLKKLNKLKVGDLVLQNGYAGIMIREIVEESNFSIPEMYRRYSEIGYYPITKSNLLDFNPKKIQIIKLNYEIK